MRRTRRRRRNNGSGFAREAGWILFAFCIGLAALDYVGRGNVDLAPASRAPERQPFTLAGIVSHVRDGDTIEVDGVPVRLATLDCAELGTPDGERAKTFLRAQLRNKVVECSLEGRKTYDREVGNCAIGGTQDIGELMIAGGYCGRWR